MLTIPYQIKDLLVINLHVRTCNDAFLLLLIRYAIEYVLDDTGNDASAITVVIVLQLGKVASHGVGFARARLSICKNTAVIALN